MEAGTQPPLPSAPASADPVDPAGGAEEPQTGRPSGGLRSFKFERWALLFAWAAVVILFSLLKPGTYPTSGNFQTIFGSQAVLLILSLGLILPLTTGDFDLSIASNMSFSAMLIAVLNVQHGWSIVPAILAGVLAARHRGHHQRRSGRADRDRFVHRHARHRDGDAGIRAMDQLTPTTSPARRPV